MRKKTKLTDEVKQYVSKHLPKSTVEKVAKDLNFDLKILQSYIDTFKSDKKESQAEESPAIEKQKKQVTVMTKTKSAELDNMSIVNDKVVFNKTSEVQIDPKRIFVQPDR
jgi:lysyl-tRNA synthetase class I